MNILDQALALVAPHICVSCNHEGAVLCKMCALNLPTLPSICYVCAKATKNNAACNVHITKYSPQSVFIAAEYANEVKAAIHAYKFDYKRAAAKDIAFFLHTTLPYFDEDIVITYVPTTGVHVRERGFDNMRLLTKELSRLQKHPYNRMLVRISNVSQKGADRKTRKQQLTNAFRADDVVIKGKNILLLDDVLTTGATIEACTKILYQAGAKQVMAAVVARTP